MTKTGNHGLVVNGNLDRNLRLPKSQNKKYRGFEVFGKVEGDWPTSKSIQNIIPITLAALPPSQALKNTRQTSFNENNICTMFP